MMPTSLLDRVRQVSPASLPSGFTRVSVQVAGKGNDMNNTKLTLEDFHPLVEMIEQREKIVPEYYGKYRDALDILNAIEARQDAESEKIAAMLEKLNTEEQQLHKKLREQTTQRAKALISGQKPAESDAALAARLAAIPDERAALNILRGSKSMTDEEREKYKAAFAEVVAAGNALKALNSKYMAELVKMKVFFYEEVERCKGGTENVNTSTLTSRAYALNRGAEEDDEEEIEDEGETLRGRRIV